MFILERIMVQPAAMENIADKVFARPLDFIPLPYLLSKSFHCDSLL